MSSVLIFDDNLVKTIAVQEVLVKFFGIEVERIFSFSDFKNFRRQIPSNQREAFLNQAVILFMDKHLGFSGRSEDDGDFIVSCLKEMGYHGKIVGISDDGKVNEADINVLGSMFEIVLSRGYITGHLDEVQTLINEVFSEDTEKGGETKNR